MSGKMVGIVFEEMVELKGGKLLVMLALADHSNADGVCWPSRTRISQYARLSRRQVTRVISELEEEGYIQIASKGSGRGNSTLYRINVDKMSPISVDKKGDKPSTEKGDISDTKGDISDTKGDITSHAHVEPSIEPLIEPSDMNLEPDGSEDDVVDVYNYAGEVVDTIEVQKPKLNAWQELVGSVTNCVHGHRDFSMIPKDGPTGQGALQRESKIIKDAGYTYEDVNTWWSKVWVPRYSWTKKGGQAIKRPMPSEVRAGIPAINGQETIEEKVATLPTSMQSIYNLMQREEYRG